MILLTFVIPNDCIIIWDHIWSQTISTISETDGSRQGYPNRSSFLISFPFFSLFLLKVNNRYYSFIPTPAKWKNIILNFWTFLQKVGKISDVGFTYDDLLLIKQHFEERGCEVIIIELHSVLKIEEQRRILK